MEPGRIATFDHRDFALDLLVEARGRRRITVCIPAHDEAETIGAIVTAVREVLVERAGLVDELLVVDDASTDGTASVAAGAGATLVPPSPFGARPGKGEAMARGLEFSTGDLVVFLDGDVENFGPHFVTGLLGPLLLDPALALVKATYQRPIGGQPTGGGRVTELVARPLLSLLFPDLAGVAQPLAGETAARRDVLESCTLAPGYGVEMAMLVDIANLYGVGALAQVDLGARAHRNRPLHELAPQAADVLRAALDRAGIPVT